MSQNILMAEPNISEGRNLEVVEAIVQAVRGVSGVTLADYSSDADHNRSVISLIGSPEAVLEGAKALADKAYELIDMSKHQGEHPRQGAIDVCAFIPIRGLDSEEAVEISRRFGKYVGNNAATRPERKSLPAIRKGEYEALAAKLEDPAWAPDEGPAVFNAKSGALVTGSRFPLIAFNANLRTTDLSIAKAIARAVRLSSGGWMAVPTFARSRPLRDVLTG